MITEIVSNAADAVNIISIFFIRMVFTAVITAPLILFSAAISRCMKAPRRYAYRMWCMTGAAVFLLIAGSAVSMLPSGVLSQFNEGAASYTDVQNTDLPEPIQGNTDLQDEMSDALGSQASGSKISESADVTVNSASDGRSSVTVSGYNGSTASPAIPEEQRFKQHKIISSALSAAARVSSLEADLASGKYSKIVAAAGMLYIAVAFFMIFMNAVRYITLRMMLRTACLLKTENADDAVCNRKFGKIRVYESSCITTPFTSGIIKPAIFVPTGMRKTQLDNVLYHEMAHIERNDHMKMSAAAFTASILWFDPLVWLVLSMFRRDMELSCDDIAVKDMDSEARRSYAKVLIEAAPVGAVRYGSAVFMSDRRYFESRVINILNNDRGSNNAGAKRRSAAAVAVSAVLCAVVLVAGGIALSVMHLYSYGANEGNDNNVGVYDNDIVYDGIQEKLDENFAELKGKGITVNAVMLDTDGNVIASIGNTEISVAPGSAVSPLVAALLMEDDPDCMEMEVPSDGFTLSDGSRINNWMQGYHKGESITLRQAFSELSNSAGAYALINADDAIVEKLKDLYDSDSLTEDINSESDEIIRAKLATGQYSIKLNDLADTMSHFIGNDTHQDGSDLHINTKQRAELNKIFSEGLSWYFNYRANTGFDNDIRVNELYNNAENLKISASFGSTIEDTDGNDIIQSVCAGYGNYEGLPVYFAIQAVSDPLSSSIPTLFGDYLATNINQVFEN